MAKFNLFISNYNLYHIYNTYIIIYIYSFLIKVSYHTRNTSFLETFKHKHETLTNLQSIEFVFFKLL